MWKLGNKNYFNFFLFLGVRYDYKFRSRDFQLRRSMLWETSGRKVINDWNNLVRNC